MRKNKKLILLLSSSLSVSSLILTLSANYSKQDVNIAINDVDYVFDKVNSNISDDIWTGYNNYSDGTLHRWYNSLDSKGVTNLSQTGNNKLKWSATGDAWYRLFDASTPGLPANINQTNWNGGGFANEIGHMYSWERDGASSSLPDGTGSWWNGNGFNPLTNSKKIKVGINLTNADTNNDFFTAGIYFSDDIRLVGNIKIHLFVKQDSSSVNIDQTEGKLTTYTININDDPKANIGTMEISPWIGKTQQVTSTGKSVSTTINGKSKMAYISDYAYLPYYDHIPDEYENNMSDTNRNQRNWWQNTRQQGSNELYDVLIRGYTPQSVRNSNFSFTTNKYNQVAFGLFQHSIIRNSTPIITKNNITQNQGGLFVFRVNTSTSHNEIVAGAVVELEMKPFNNSTEPFNQLYAGNTGSTTGSKTYFGVSEYRNLNSRDDYKVIGGFMKMADRKQSYLKKFNTEEKVQDNLEFYNQATDGIPQANLSISEIGNSSFAYNIDKNGVSNDNKNVIRTRNIYQDYKSYNNLSNLRLNASFANGVDRQKWRMITKSTTVSASTTFGREYLDFAPIEYTFTDLEYLKRYIQSKKWLTKGEKDALTRYVEADTSFNIGNEFTDATAKNSWKTKIDTIDDLQKSIEEKYKDIREFALGAEIYDKNWNPIATNKMIYALADLSVKNSLKDFTNTNSDIIKLKSSEYNDDTNAQDRSTSTKYDTAESFDYLTKILQTIKKVLTDKFDAIKTSGKNNLDSIYAKLNDFSITQANSQTYPNNNSKAANLLTNNLIQNVINPLTNYEQVQAFDSANSESYKSKIKNVLDSIKNLNDLEAEKDNLKTQIIKEQKAQNDFNHYGVFTRSTNSINLNSFDTFDANLKDAANKTIDNIFDSTQTLNTFYTNGNNTLQQNWINKLTGDEINGALQEFKKEINNFSFLNGDETSGEKFNIINNLEVQLGWNGPFTYNTKTKTLAINTSYYSTIDQAMQSAFSTAKNNAKTKINNLSFLSQAEKNNVNQLIDQAQLYKDTYVPNEDYSNKVLIGSDKNIKTIADKWTDINTEREKIKDYTATFDYPDKSINPTTADQNLITTQSVRPNDQGVETKIINIQGNDDAGTLVVTYKILKSSDKDNIYTENKTYTITGFSDEQTRIADLSATPEYKDKAQKVNIQASTVVKANNSSVDIVWELPTNTKIYANSVRYLGYNDITGKIKITYKLQSTKNTNAISDEKTAEITGFQNEITRLNNLVNQDSNTNKITNITIVSNPIKRASDSILNTDYNVNLIDSNFANTNQISLTNVNQTATDDVSGSVTYTYKFKTTRSASDLVTIEGQTVNNNNIYSNVTNPQTRTGFLTQAQYEQNQRDAAKKAIDNYQYLNNAQKNAIKEAIQNAPIDQLDQKVADANDLNNAMKAYIESTNNIDTIKQGIDYTQADNQSALDNAVNQQKTDVNKTQGSNLSLTEVKQRTKTIQDAITNLNGEERLQKAKDDAIAKINSDYSSLTEKQKAKAIELIKSQNTIAGVNTQDANNSALNASMKTLRDFITNQNNIVTGNNYLYTTDALRSAYDGNPAKNNNQKGGVIKEAEDLLTNLNTDNNNDLMNKTNVDSLNTKIQNAINNLNGQQRYDAELARLNSLQSASAKVKDSAQSSKTASEIVKDDIEFNTSTIPADVKPVNLDISNQNEVTGKLDLSYKYQSTKENMETLQSNTTYTLSGNNALSTLTEEARLNQLIDDNNIAKTINFNGTKNQNAIEDLAKTQFNGTLANSENNKAQIVIDSIAPDPTDEHAVIVTYKLQSTKDNLNNQTIVSKTAQTKITGFMSDKEKEQNTINSYNDANFVGTPNSTKLASSFVALPKNVNITFATNDNANHANETIEIQSVKSWDDVNGTLTAVFVVKSNKHGEELTSTEKEITITGYFTEEQRLNNLIDNKDKEFNFSGTKAKDKTTVDEVTKDNLSGYLAEQLNGQLTNINNQNNVELVIDSISETNPDGSVKFTYHLKSTRTDIANNTVVSKTLSTTMSGFQSNISREKANLDAKTDADLDVVIDKTQMASSFKPNQIQLNPKDNTISVVNKTITGYNDVIGAIKLTYKLKSNKNGQDVYSEPKEIIITGLKTEAQRLNEILNNLVEGDITFSGTKNNQLPSVNPANDKANYSYDATKQKTNKASAFINSITPDDSTGQNTLNLKLVTSKTQNELISNWNVTNYEAPESQNKDLVITGFRTQAQQNKIDQDAEKARLTNLVANTEITYPNSKQILASSSAVSGIHKVINSTDNNAEIIIQNITDKNDLDGAITVAYVIHSTKGGIYKNVNTNVQTVVLNNFKTEQQRLDALFTNNQADASLTGIASADYSKYLPQEALDHLTLTLNNLENARVEIVSKVANNQTNSIDYKYRLVSTRGVVSGHDLNTVTSTETKSGSLKGFKTLVQAEKERLDNINPDDKNDGYTHTINYSNRDQILSSKVKISDSNWTWEISPTSDHTFSDQKIIAYDDITGKLRVRYKLQSTKEGLTDVKSDYKYVTLTGFKTELDRLNDLVVQQNQPVSIAAKEDRKNEGANEKKASQLTSDDFNVELTQYGQGQNVQIETILDTQNANDETGTIDLGYKLISTRPLEGQNGLIAGDWTDAPSTAPVIKSNTSNPLLSFTGYVTNDEEEENRIERLIPDLVIDYPNKQNYLPDFNITDVVSNNVQVKLSDNRELNEAQIALKTGSMQILSRDDRKGEITVSYTLVSQSRNNVEIVINQTRSKNANTIKGFKTELQRLQTLNYDWANTIANKANISPSDVILNNITPYATDNDQAKDITITGFDDRNGTLDIQYNIYSKRTDLTDIYVVNKTAQITGLQTELQRLNALVDNDQVSKTINYVANDKAQIKASSLVNKKAEVLANNDNSYFTTLIQDPATSKAKIIIKDITADDETGQLTVKYVLQSTKDNLTDINSDTENTVTISGFLTNLQEAKNNLKAEIDELVQNNKLTSEQAQALKDKINSTDTDSIDKVNKIKLEVDKQVLVNEVEKDFVHLNKAQLTDVINKIKTAENLDKANEAKNDGQTLDDKMAKLDEIVKNYEAKKPLDKYTHASETPKNTFDKVIEDAKKLLDKTNTTDLGTDNLDNWIGNEETNTKGEIQTKYEALDGDIQKTIQEVTNNEYLSPKQKEDLINKLNSLDPNTLEKANDDGTKLTLNDIKDEIAQIEALKKEAINRIKAYENLNQQQKDAYINQIKSSDNDQLETIENNATALDNKMLELKQAIENVKDVPNSSAYQNADQNNKDAFDNALNVANKIKNGKENTYPSDTFNYNANLDAVQKAIDGLKLANTNINRDEALKYVDNAPYLSADEKATFKEQLNQNPITDETIAKLKEQAQIINNAKKVYVDQIKAIDNNDLDQNNKDEYINQIINKEMTLDENNVITNPEEFSKIVFDAQKEALINKLENNVNQPDLPNILNPKQLTEAKEAINNATDLAEAQKAYEDAINLSKKMAALDELVKNYEKSIADPNNTKYNKADNKEQFDNKLTEAKKLLTSDSDNGVDNKLLEDLLSNNDKSLQHSYEELNGLENDLIEQINNSEVLSPNEKTDLITQVNNIDKHNDEAGQVETLQDKLNKLIADKNNNIKAIQNLENLNQSQKDDLINRIKNNDLADNPSILDEAQNLDNKMKELKDEIAKENIIKGLSHYNKASEEKRNNYENALNNAKKLVNNETPNGYNSANTSIAETQEILDKLKQAFKAIDDEAKKINDLYDKLNAKIIEYQKDVDNKELPKEIQDILDELVNYGEDVNGINKLIELIKQGKLLKSLHEQWNNSDFKNPDTEKAIQDLNDKINSITELINSVESSNLNSKLDTSKDFVLNHNQYNLNFAEAEISYFDALKNVDKTKFIDATNKLEQLEQAKFVEFANSILNTSYFDTYKPESNLNKKLIKELLKLNYDPLNKIEKSLFETLLKEKAGVEEKLSWLWYLALGLSTTLAAIMIGVLVKKVKNNS
ncbi:lipoprotein 17-related variable surface protein [Mycoplasmopsis gallinacea]|uniref:ECM-binding protein homolog n=1 Tax=Mycoplasmopsis gallinacea TaxID=29556 RepID=A0A449A307_9BACT|nr:lipoprotein 17-related variable surface protein [Mycoplasmopsis gallinacea]VEU58636.1 ECM-binding protein homolog [Mycoplasmopsis gallinacea]